MLGLKTSALRVAGVILLLLPIAYAGAYYLMVEPTLDDISTHRLPMYPMLHGRYPDYSGGVSEYDAWTKREKDYFESMKRWQAFFGPIQWLDEWIRADMWAGRDG